MHITVVIPAHNEEARIGATLRAYGDAFDAAFAPGTWEIVVALNCCTDGTERVVADAAAARPALRWVTENARRGKGAAVRAGLAAADGERVVFVDADNMVGPAEALRQLAALDAADVAIGWRQEQTAVGGPTRSAARRLVSGLAPLWTRALLRLPYHDPQCGAKAFRREAVAALLPLLRETGWALDIELLLAAKRCGLNVVELPVGWRHVVEGSKVRLPQALWQVFRATLRLRFRRDWGERKST